MKKGKSSLSMRVIIESFARDALRFSADYVIERITAYEPTEEKPFTIVLPSPEPSVMYFFECLVCAYKERKISYKNVVFFELEEFRSIDKCDSRSFASKLYDAFFKHVDARPENVFFLNGVARDYKEECDCYEKAIESYGGLNLVCANINSEASIGGNTPGSSLSSRTRQKTRTSIIINDRCHTRNGIQDVEMEEICPCQEDVPTNYVLTMGLETIMRAYEVIALFIGYPTARALHHVLEDPISNLFPASVLQSHERACIICEKKSISTLKYTTVEYFVGIRDTYNEVYHLESGSMFGLTPYQHSKRYTSYSPQELDSGTLEAAEETPFFPLSEFGIQCIRSRTPLADEEIDKT